MRLVIALDRSEYAEIVLEHGLDEANRRQADAIHVVTVVASADRVEPARAGLEAMLSEGLDAFHPTGRVIVDVLVGEPVDAITALAREQPPDLLVLGRFHAPSVSDEVVARVASPTLVVGIDGPVLEPQCPACAQVRRDTDGERLFCVAHTSDILPDLTTRLPSSTYIHSRMW